MGDMSHVIIPRSDQINADDLLSGPMTIKITSVKVSPGQEQPVSIYFDGSEKAYRCCKSMARVLVSAWGADSSKYIGRSLTLYCDPKVKWGGMEVGGIRISHMSDIDSAITLALTVTRANKKPFTVRPIQKTSAAQGSGAVTPSSDLPDPAAAGPESAASQDIVAGSAPVKEAAPTGKPTENAADFQDSGSIYITVDQALHLSELCKDYGVDEVKVCRTFSASKISLISAVNYKRAFDYIEKARK